MICLFFSLIIFFPYCSEAISKTNLFLLHLYYSEKEEKELRNDNDFSSYS